MNVNVYLIAALVLVVVILAVVVYKNRGKLSPSAGISLLEDHAKSLADLFEQTATALESRVESALKNPAPVSPPAAATPATASEPAVAASSAGGGTDPATAHAALDATIATHQAIVDNAKAAKSALTTAQQALADATAAASATAK